MGIIFVALFGVAATKLMTTEIRVAVVLLIAWSIIRWLLS